MSRFNTQNLDVKRTIESTLDRAKGWLLGSYSSAAMPEQKITIDVRYPCKTISKDNTPDELNLSAQPTSVVIQRGNNIVSMKKNLFFDKKTGWEKASYILSIHSTNLNYRIIETPDGNIKDRGDSLLLWALQKDKDFSNYISFFSKNEKENSCVSTQKWNLNKMMTQSREIQ